MLTMRRLAFASLALLAALPAAAQVRVVVDGRMQDVPAGMIRTVSYEPGGRQTIHDEPFRGAVMPGAATVTTTETTDEDEAGRALRTTVVTRIEPMAAVAYAPPPGYAVQPAIYTAPVPQGPLVETPDVETAELDTPQPDTDADRLDAPAPVPADAHPQIVHIRRDALTGHFIAPIRINGVAVRAIVDTGAQTTVLSARDARATGADRDVTATQAMAGIGGYSMLKVTRIRSMDVGGQQLGGCTASIGQEGIPYTLLGQTEIARLGRIVIDNGEMTITPRSLEIATR
jgi:clan AA aspartic protease (TIGR02281 family)